MHLICRLEDVECLLITNVVGEPSQAVGDILNALFSACNRIKINSASG